MLCYIYKYNTILTLITIMHVFISLILSYTLYDQIVLLNWINQNTTIEDINSNFNLSSYTTCYWFINGFWVLLIVYIIIVNNLI